ncbi:hypothetical protein SAMN04488057_110148 [Cyclobacterium lianum]|uniref:Uncharacterized protein n=1 Tax=Cyclobacterium lianum TaxID=388280 RepID=A0A1M7PU29_9BACT|nr:hypothetical protein [Cyclobacterium lianum]SHN20882.1 hypothetical protein SAMN04488057_110148 [Cyclobacterium lianum]
MSSFSTAKKTHPIFLIILAVWCFSCETSLLEEVKVYDNDFSQSDLLYFEKGRLFDFNGDTVLGYFHNEEIALNLPDLPEHNTIKVTIDLLLHDSWDGNPDNVGGPDFWYMNLDGQQVLRTTFSNSPCESTYCLYQSFPNNFPRFYEPKTGAVRSDLPGRCQYQNSNGWTSHYQITRIISHSANSLAIVCGDELKQENAADPVCDESWSIARIRVSTMTLN